MIVERAVELYLEYLNGNTRPNTIRSFSFTLIKFKEKFSGREMGAIKDGEIIEFIMAISPGCSSSTKSSRVSSIRAFYNFIIEVADLDIVNPCMRPMVRKMFKTPRGSSPKLLDKDLIDEIIFRTTSERDRLILELMGRAGMRVGEVLGIRLQDVDFDSATITVAEPKSGRVGEKVYVAKKLAGKLHTYSLKSKVPSHSRIFDVSYSTAYRMVRQAARVVNASLRPHDLRRHAATQASRSNIPLEIVSKVILRHADISTTQRYLGSIDPTEASRWVEHLHR